VANPTSTTAASEVLKIWEEENLTDRAAQVGEYLMRQLAGLKEHAIVGDVRGLGLMVAIEFVCDRVTKEPFPVEKQVAKLVGKFALQNGLVTYPGTGMVDGQRGDVISLFPPLIFTPQHVVELVSKLDQTLTQVEQVM
jgi:adenosylmethionine-8-amino-7-oxononanoate aminotransferase